MYDDLHQIYVDWSNRTGLTSILDFSDYVWKTTGVMLSDVITDEEREWLLQKAFEGDEGLLEGMDSGP